MQLIKNDYEYRNWMMNSYFTQGGVQGDSLLSDEELEEFLFECRPKEYPCLGTLTPSAIGLFDNDIAFIYREQVSAWAQAMGVTKS